VEIEWGQDGSIAAWWDDAGVPCRASFDRPDAQRIHAMPDRPTQMSVNRPELLRAMIDAATCCDPGSVRYSLGCLQLDGAKGRIAATDGRQIFRASGFQFPWPETVLVPKPSVFAWKELAGNDVSIGRQGDWLWFDIGPWSFALAIDKHGRFPDVNPFFSTSLPPVARCRLDGRDAEFLLRTLPKLPGNLEQNWPVTLDLNGSVAVRACGDQPEPTEVVLQRSTRDGESMRVNMNRRFLLRAVQLGFTEIELAAPNAPARCRDDRRAYVWAVLDAESAIPPAGNAIRVLSTAGEMPASRLKPTRRNRTVATNNNDTNGEKHSSLASPKPTAANDGTSKVKGVHRAGRKAIRQQTPDLIEQAEGLRGALRELLGKTSDLLTALKQQRRQSRLVRSTLASLRVLEKVAG
jgi:hypothetical protein